MFPWRQGGSTQGSLETGGLVAPNGIGACRPATQALGAGTLRIGGAWGMSSHQAAHTLSPEPSLPVLVAWPVCLRDKRVARQVSQAGLWAGTPSDGHSPESCGRERWVGEASRQRPLVSSANSTGQLPRALSRAGLRKHLLPRTSGRPASPPGGFLVYRPPALILASLPLATPSISSDRSRSSSFILAAAHTASLPPPLWPSSRLRAKALRAFSLPFIPGLAWFPEI